MTWPATHDALAWLQSAADLDGNDKKPAKPPSPRDLACLLAAAGGRPADALAGLQSGQAVMLAQRWQALPKAMAAGDVAALADMLPAQAVDALQKLCHDVWVVRSGGQPRFFEVKDLPAAPLGSGAHLSTYFLSAWAKELASSARTAEHPYNPGLMLESLASRAKIVLNSK